MGEQNQPKTDRRWTVLRLPPEDRELLRLLGTGTEKEAGLDNRDKVFRELAAEYIKQVELPPLPPVPERKPLRVSMPDSLDKALKEKTEGTGYTQLHVLLEAAKLFRKKHELEDEDAAPPAS